MKSAIVMGVALLACASARAADSVSVDVPVQGRENVSYAYADVLRADPIYEDIPADGAACGVTTGNDATVTIHGSQRPEVSGEGVADEAEDDAEADSAEDAPEILMKEASIGSVAPLLLADASGGVPPAACSSRALQRRIAAYNVEYRYKGALFMSRMDYDPGNKLRIRITVAPAD